MNYLVISELLIINHLNIIMENSKIMMFPEFGNNSSIDPNLLLAMNNNGGFGGNGNWIWILFLWLIWGGAYGNNGFGGGFGNNGAGFLSNQMNNDTGRELLMNAIQGNRDAINNLATLLNSEVQTVQNGIFTLNNAITSVGTQVGMSGLQIQNAIQSGNASIASQICQCCCENRLAICEQTNTLQSQIAANQAADQLAVCQQTNALQSQAERNTRDITEAINAQSVMINDKFCDLEKRELQNKIDTLTADNALLRSNANNERQTILLNDRFNQIQTELTAIKASQPNTVPVQWPQLTAVNTTPYVNGGFYGGFNGFGNGFWGNGISF